MATENVPESTENVPESWDSTCWEMERWPFSGSCSQMNGLLSQVSDLSNNEHVFLSTGDIHCPVTINLGLYELVLSPLHGRKVMYGISNSQGWCRPLFQLVIDRGSNGPAVQVWYSNAVPSNINTHTKKKKHAAHFQISLGPGGMFLFSQREWNTWCFEIWIALWNNIPDSYRFSLWRTFFFFFNGISYYKNQ